MKAIRVHELGGPEVLKLERVADLRASPGEILIRVAAVGVNPADTYVRSGAFGSRPLPYTPGSDCAGVVEEVGGGVKRFAKGARVYTSRTLSGAYAELALCSETMCHPLPDGNSFSEGAAIGTPCATAYRALFQRGGARSGETVLVHGASGAVGVAAVQLARAAGLTVIGTASTDEGRRLAHHALDHRARDEADMLLAITKQRGVDLVIEALANVNLGRDLKFLAPRGRVVVVGSRGKVEIDPRDIMARDLDLRGMSLTNATPDELIQVHAALVAALESGTLRPIIAKVIPLEDAALAHRAVIEGPALGKIVLGT